MAEVDTSSYPKAQQVNPLQTIGQVQNLVQQKVNLDASKVDLVNKQMGALYNMVSARANDPATTPEQVQADMQQALKLGIITPQQLAEFGASLPRDPTQLQPFLKNVALRTQDAAARFNQVYGVPTMVNTGAAQIPVRVGLGGVTQAGAPIQNELSPGQAAQPVEVRTPTGQTLQTNIGGRERMLGTNRVPPQQVAPMDRNAQNPLQAPPAAQPVGAGAIPAPSPLFEEGKKQLVSDQEVATNNAAPIRALQQAIPLLKTLNQKGMGPNVQGYQDTVSFLKRVGALPTGDSKLDPQAVYQAANKYLLQASEAAGATRSDLDAINKQMSNANVQQVLPAAIELAQNSLANRRLDSTRASTFKNEDFSQYGKHRSEFSQNQDLRAYRLDTMEPADRQKLVTEMADKLKKGDKEAKKFFQSLRNARDAGFL